ncbi:MAG: glycosyltransferase family 39 protein [Vicinamibacterales bacterium]
MDYSRRILWVVLLLGLVARVWMAIATPIAFDEYQWFRVVDTVDLRPSSIHVPMHGDEHPPGHVYWTAVGTWAFGQNLVGYRFASVVLGTALILFTFLLASDLFDRRTALLAAAFCAANEYLIGGVSRLSTEKSYLTFAILAVILYVRTTRNPTTRGYALTGLVFGLGTLTKQTLLLWLPVFFIDTLRRRDVRLQWGTIGPWLATVIFLLAISPDVYWNLTASRQPGLSNVGIEYQLSKLGVGEWSWGPTSLFLRFLVYPLVDPDIHEYPAMSLLPGGILLAGAVLSLFLSRTANARFLQVLGWGPFLFFSLFGSFPDDYSAFWWSDLSVVPFIILTASVVTVVTARFAARTSWLICAGVCVPFAVSAIQIARTGENAFVSTLLRPPQSAVDRALRRQRFRFAEYESVDHAAISRVGTWCLPVSRVYVASLRDYLMELDTPNDANPRNPRQDEGHKQRMRDQLQRFGTCGS